jgi:serpin B
VRAGETGQTAFALDLFRILAREPGNVFFSPLSIAAVLEMAWAGARGATAQEIASRLRLTEPEGAEGSRELVRYLVRSAGSDAELSVASRLWGQTGCAFRDSYLGILRERYGADLAGLDFSEPAVAADTINAWVAEATRGRISNLVPADALSRITRLVLTNAVYFKGQWRSPFDSSGTAPAPFWLDAEHAVDAPLMTYHGQDELGYSSADGWQVVELPYRGGSLVMDLIKPAELEEPQSPMAGMMLAYKGRPGPPQLALTLDELEARLTPEVLAIRLASLQARIVVVQIPRFELGQAADLSEPLKELGIRRAFSPEADFSGITAEERVWFDRVLHKSNLKVDEVGTEAAAATAMGMIMGIPRLFRADHPFLLLIRDAHTGAILFVGRVTNPVAAAAG